MSGETSSKDNPDTGTSPSRPGPPVQASVIVCTYNRSGLLRMTLDALAAQQVSTDISWEVIVVDNNSRDDTRDVVDNARLAFPRLRYEFQGQQGLSHARNLGIERARGVYLLFTDDDVCPEPDWLETIVLAMQEEDCDACGGYIAPIWERSPPPWLTERFYGFLALKTDKDKQYDVHALAEAPFGANMAFRRDVFDRIGNFDTKRGRIGNVLASGEEWDLFDRMLAKGMRIIFVPEARVHHRVEAYRTYRRYFIRWRFQASRNEAETEGITGDRLLFGVPLYVFPQLGRATWRALWTQLSGAADEAVFKWMLVSHLLGLASGSRRRGKTSD